MQIVEIAESDFKNFWPAFREIIQAQETYAFDPELDYEAGYELWCRYPQICYVAKENDTVLGSYYLRPNASGPSSHICNCGYMVSPLARGKGIATILCNHSQEMAIQLGYTAMQFNSVVSTNEAAVKLWTRLGFNTVGTIPLGYKHRRLGYVDCLVMHKQLGLESSINK